MPTPTMIGRYEVVSVLGQGAMGTVYKAVDPVIERTVAIKTINLDFSNEELAEFEARFYREAKSAGRLNHSSIVTIYDVGEVDNVAYIAMEYIQGESLREMLDSGVVLPLGTICTITAQVAAALDYAHQNNVVHRDIKPANIMITPERDVKIMDFGIAQIPTGSRTQLGTVLGSPKYMAPEQVDGEPADGRTDVFALGVVVYEMLTGTVPFNGDNLSAIMFRILNDEPTPPSVVNPRVPQEFDRILSRALAKRPDARYQRARELATELRNQEARLPESERSTVTGGVTKPAPAGRAAVGQQDGTIFLPPRRAQATPDKNAGSGRAGFTTWVATLWHTPSTMRQVLIWGVPILVVVLVLVYGQRAPFQLGAAPELAAVTPPEAAVAVIPPLLPAVPLPDNLLTTPVTPVRAIPAAVVASEPERVAPRKATMSFAISPWGEVYVDGERVGIAPPLNNLQVDAGKHAIEIRNPGFAPYRDTVNLNPEQSLKIRHKFR